MDETINKETVSGEPGAEEKPTSQPSDTQAAPSAVDVDSLKGILEPLVQDAFERQQQSLKDKRFAKQESRISSLEDTLAQVKELKDEGMSEKQAILHMEMKEFLATQGQVPTEVPPQEEKATQPTVAADDLLSSVLNLAGLKDTDADVIAIMREHPNDSSKQAIEVEALVNSRKQAQQTPASAAAVMPSGGGAAVDTDTVDSLSKRLNELVDLPVQTAESEAERAEIREKLNQLQPIQKTIVGV